jgi:flavin-dependent dehydrogenase
VEVTVYEKDESVDSRSRDWTILIHWALPLLEKLLPDDLVAKLPSAVCNPNLDFNEDVECLPVYNGATDELLFKSPTPGARRVSRQRMRKLLLEGLDIRWGCKVKSIEALDNNNAVSLVFEEREAVQVGFVVGADGASSKVREVLLGEEKARATGCGLMFATGMATYGESEKVMKIIEKHPVSSVSMGAEAVGSVGGETNLVRVRARAKTDTIPQYFPLELLVVWRTGRLSG